MTVEEIDLYWMKAEDLAKYLPSGGCAKVGAKTANELAEKLLAKSVRAADCPEVDKKMAEAIDAVLSITTRLPESDPMQEKVEENLLEYGEPNGDSPVIITSNSKLTQKILKEIFDRAKVRVFVIPVDTNGYTLDNSVATNKMTPMAVMKGITDSGIAGKISSKKAIISGLLANQKSGIERIARWSLEVGPISGYELPLYLLSR